MADAIPTWTQPVSPGGNWDEVRMSLSCERDLISLMRTQVVLPVVARKKSMDEFYTSADGRQQKKPASRIPEPVSADLVPVYLSLGKRC